MPSIANQTDVELGGAAGVLVRRRRDRVRLDALLHELGDARATGTRQRTAPTRPHPVVARRPPGKVVAALPLSVLDRTRVLAAAAGALEHVPPLTTGERSSTSRSE